MDDNEEIQRLLDKNNRLVLDIKRLEQEVTNKDRALKLVAGRVIELGDILEKSL